MKSITQDLKFKQAAITYSFKYGVTKAAIQYKKTRQWIYYWRKRYIPGDIHSLQEKSRKPHSHPNAHKNTEILLIENMRRRNPDEGLTMFWIKLQKRGYTRCITSLYRVMQKLGYYKHEKKKKDGYVPKKYEQMQYPGQRIQVDCKYVPLECTKAMGEGVRLFQFTAIDEYSRQRYLEAFEDNSSYSAAIFIEHAIAFFKYPIECVQTDNGQEFTKYFGHDKRRELSPTMFQKVLYAHRIIHKQIRAYTPRHNGKVERSHRKDNERFYSKHRFYSLDDLQRQLKRYMGEYNNTPMRPLGRKSPNEYLANFLTTMCNKCLTNLHKTVFCKTKGIEKQKKI